MVCIQVAEAPPMFGYFMNLSAAAPLYQEISDMAALKTVMQEQLGDYNVTSTKPMDLVLFQVMRASN